MISLFDRVTTSAPFFGKVGWNFKKEAHAIASWTMPSCHRNAAKTALKLSATDGEIACLTGSFWGIVTLEVVGSCWRFAGEMARFDCLLSFLVNFGDVRFGSSLQEVPMEKWRWICCDELFSGEVCVPVCISLGASSSFFGDCGGLHSERVWRELPLGDVQSRGCVA